MAAVDPARAGTSAADRAAEEAGPGQGGRWPQVRDFEDFEKALDDFEKNLAELALSAQKSKLATPQ